MAAIGERREERGIFGVDAISEAFEFEIAHDFLLQKARKIGGRGDAVAGPDLLSDGASSDHLARFEHENAAPRASEIRRAHQAVVAATNDNRVVRPKHRVSS